MTKLLHGGDVSMENVTKNKEIAKKQDALEIVSYIRERGLKASMKYQKSPKNTPDKKKTCRTPQNTDKLTPIRFPVFESEDKLAIETIKEVTDKPSTRKEETTHEFTSTQETNEPVFQKLEPETTPLQVVDKVRNQQKDVSLPLVTEIQKMPLKDSSYEHSAQLPPRPSGKVTPNAMQKHHQVIETIREQHGNLRSPAKITNKMIVPIEENSLQPLNEEDSEFKTPLPKKPRSASKHDSGSKKSGIVNTFPMRIDFNDRPKEYDDIILPRKFQMVFDFFVELDNAINNCKRRGKIPVLSNLKPYIEQSTNRTFDIDQFAKVYYIAPELFYCTWQATQGVGNHELRIEVPENIEEIVTKVHKKEITVKVSMSPLSEPMTNFLTNKRKIILRTRLILYIESLHNNFLGHNGYKKSDYNAIKGWHPNFDIQDVMDLPKKPIDALQKSRKSESISEFLKNKNIKHTLLRRAAEKSLNESNIKTEMQPGSSSTMNSSNMHPSPEKRSPAKINNASISPTFYKRIETKEKMYQEEKDIIERENKLGEKKRKQELMLKISQAVKSVFSVKGKVSTLFLNHVLKFLNDSQRGNFYTKKELISTLKEISEIVPEWLTLKQHDRGFLVKICKKVNISTIRFKIINHVE